MRQQTGRNVCRDSLVTHYLLLSPTAGNLLLRRGRFALVGGGGGGGEGRGAEREGFCCENKKKSRVFSFRFLLCPKGRTTSPLLLLLLRFVSLPLPHVSCYSSCLSCTGLGPVPTPRAMSFAHTHKGNTPCRLHCAYCPVSSACRWLVEGTQLDVWRVVQCVLRILG